jgi:hypothetical protein
VPAEFLRLQSRPAGCTLEELADGIGVQAALRYMSLAHITQAESEALKEFDIAVGRIESAVAEQKKPKINSSEEPAKPVAAVRKQRIIKPTEIMKAVYLETPDDVNNFLNALRQELENALANNERIQIR